MDIPEDVADIEVLTRRRDFLSCLDGEPAEKPTIVENLDHSRSTVDRAIRALEDAGFVERTTGGYATTLTGRLAMERYDSFLAESEAILDAKPVIDALPCSVELPQDAVTDGAVEHFDDQYELFEVLIETLPVADNCRVLLPHVSDSRHFRLLHSQVTDGELDVTFCSCEQTYRQLAREFPYLAADLEETASFTPVRTQALDFGLALIDAGGDRTAVIVAYDDQSVVGVVRTDEPTVIEWASDVADRVLADATPVETFGTAPDRGTFHEMDDQRLPAPLRSQGFERLDETFFENRTTLDPVTAWRAGLSLSEVAAGYAIDRFRESEGDRESVVQSLLDALDDGADLALLGPPGSGKSTVCKQVAYQWFDSQRGTVLYRESGRGQSFDDVGSLEATIGRGEGHTLIVVEDAVRAEANVIFEVMQSFSGRTDVTFLLDAREAEWNDAEEFPIDARLETFRQRHVNTVQMPSLDDAERRAILDRFADIADVERDGLPATFEDAAATSSVTGTAFLFFHRLARFAQPVGEDATPTTLEEHVERVRDRLVAAGEPTLDVGVLANTLNAAGIGVTPVALHAVAAGLEHVDHTTVRRAIDALDGEVLFGDADDGAFRTVHAAWSVEFLDQLAETDEAAADRFGRTVTALLSLADHGDRREAVASAVTGSTDLLGTIAAEPTGWADDVAGQLFDLGESYPRLAGLFDTTDRSTLTLPAACRRETALRQRVVRGYMFNWAGQFDRAAEEFGWLVETLPDPTTSHDPDALSGRLYARAKLGMTRVENASDVAAAKERGEEALAAHRAVEDDRGAVETMIELVTLELHAGNLDAAQEYADRASALADQLDDDGLKARALKGAVMVADTNDEYERVAELAERGIDLARDVAAIRAERRLIHYLALSNHRMGKLERAVEYNQRSAHLSRRLGDWHMACASQVAQAMCVLDQGQFDRARQLLDSLKDAPAESFVAIEAAATAIRGLIELYTDRPEQAIAQFRSLVDGDDATARALTFAHVGLTDAVLDSNDPDPDRAAQHAETALDLAEQAGTSRFVSRAERARGRAALVAGDLDAAERRYRHAKSIATDNSLRLRALEAERGLGHVARERGTHDQAREHYESVLDGARETGAIRIALDVVADLAEIDGSEWYALGADIAAEADLDDRADELRERADAREHEQRPETD